MKQVVFALLGVVLATASSRAADIPIKAPVYKAPLAQTYDWSGVYGGVSVGSASEVVRGNFAAVGFPDDNHNTSKTRGMFGGFAGVQRQWANVVAGAEVSLSDPFKQSFAKTVSGTNACIISNPFPFWCEARTSNLFTAGGRLGWAHDRWMVYGTGGYARGSLETRFEAIGINLVTDDIKTHHDGWYAGGGIEYAISLGLLPDLIVGIEYRHVDLATRRQEDPPANTRDMRAHEDIVNLRLAFKFNPVSNPR